MLFTGCGGGDDNGGGGGEETGGAGGGASAGAIGSTGGSGGGRASSSAAGGQVGSSSGAQTSSSRTGGAGGSSSHDAGKTGSAAGTTSTGGTSSSSASRIGGTGGSASTTGSSGGTGGPATVALREGRFDTTDPAHPSFGWSGSALVARFQGTGAVASIDGSPNQFTVIIDGNVSSTILKVVSGTSQYTVASGLATGTHDLVIARRTEGSQGPSRFSGLEITGGQLLAPPPAPERRIELFGDSISAGYGLDGKGPNCSFTPDTENHYLTYAAIAARTVQAELHTNAWSGIGMYRNYGVEGPSSDAMPAVYARTIPDRSRNDWDFATWQPQVVIINLGTNDASSKGDPGEPFRKAYLDFVRTLHGKYPDAFFILSIGPMLSGAELTAISGHLQSVIDAMAGEGFTKMSRLVFPTQSESDGLGCDWHPSPATNAKMATQLVSELKAKLTW